MSAEEGVTLKRFIHAAKGRHLSWSATTDVNHVLHTSYSGDDKLSPKDRARLQVVIEEMQARGVVAPETLLTKHQLLAQAKRNKA